MLDLTDKQKEDCQRAINSIVNYLYDTLKIRLETVSFETALDEIMGKIMPKYFVWIKNSFGRPEAQVWFGKQADGNGKAKETLACHEITEAETSLGIIKLAERYPLEAVK